MGADLVSISDQDEMDFVLLISYVRTYYISYCYHIIFLVKKHTFSLPSDVFFNGSACC